MDAGPYLRIIAMFGGLSVMSIGGGSSLIPQMHLDAVARYHWMTDGQFADIFSIAQSAPGPSSLIVSLIGYSAGGLPGALIATVAMILPASLLVYISARTWIRSSGARWHDAVEFALAPLSVGLIVATAVIMSVAIQMSLPSLALMLVATAIMSLTKLNPLILVAIGGMLGYLDVL